MDRESLKRAADRVVDEWGAIDVLVNNAIHTGPGSMLRFEDTTIEMIETKLAANVVARSCSSRRCCPTWSSAAPGRSST